MIMMMMMMMTTTIMMMLPANLIPAPQLLRGTLHSAYILLAERQASFEDAEPQW
jgi:hypothetical protein